MDYSIKMSLFHRAAETCQYPSPITTCWAHDGAGIGTFASLCGVLRYTHAARLAQALLPLCHTVWVPRSRFTAMRAVEDTGISTLLAGCPRSTQTHRQDHMDKEATTITKNE